MQCDRCNYEWPEGVVSCAFCGAGLTSANVDSNSETIAMDMTRVDIPQLSAYFTYADGLSAKFRAVLKVASILVRRFLGRSSWAPVLTSNTAAVEVLDPDAMIPPEAEKLFAGKRKTLEELGFKHIGNCIALYRQNAPFVMALSNPSALCVAQICVLRPGMPTGDIEVLFETHYSDGRYISTLDRPFPNSLAAPWMDLCSTPNEPLPQLLRIHLERLKHASCETAYPLVISTMDKFLEIERAYTTRWLEWAMTERLYAKIKTRDLGKR